MQKGRTGCVRTERRNIVTKVINLFSGPGAGKSTTAAGIFYLMKRNGHSVELVQEYAKECVWDNSIDKMADQFYLLAKQNRRLDRLVGKVDYIVTDSPLLLCAYYGDKYGRHPDIIVPVTTILFNKYDNHNYFLERTKPFDPRGRLGGEDNAREADAGIKELLKMHSYTTLTEGPETVNEIYRGLI